MLLVAVKPVYLRTNLTNRIVFIAVELVHLRILPVEERLMSNAV